MRRIGDADYTITVVCRQMQGVLEMPTSPFFYLSVERLFCWPVERLGKFLT